MTYLRRALPGLVALLACSIGIAQSAEPALTVPASAKRAATLLDGEEKSFLLVGYSTSYAWPRMLQQMLDEHAGGKRVYHVLNAVIGGAAVERWIQPKGDPWTERTLGAMDRDFFGDAPRLRGEAPVPKIALCQQSLQFTRTQRGPIARSDDREGIEIGADALEKLARLLTDRGIEHVYYGMHIYKQPIEPEVGNERIALAALLKRGLPFVHAGPDVWQPTHDLFPACFDDDDVHPNLLGMKIMALGWYKTIAGAAAKSDVIRRMFARDYDVRPMMYDYLRWRREGGAEPKIILAGDPPAKDEKRD